MRFDVATLNEHVIPLGKRGENNARTIEIDVQSWLALWPGASVAVIVFRQGDVAPYIAVTSVENGVLYWPITSAETEKAGDGLIELRATCGEVIKKSATARTHVSPCLVCTGDTKPPEAAKAWTDQVLKAADDAKRSAESVLGCVGDASAAAESALVAAGSALASAENASTSAGQALASAESALASAEKAEQAAAACRVLLTVDADGAATISGTTLNVAADGSATI